MTPPAAGVSIDERPAGAAALGAGGGDGAHARAAQLSPCDAHTAGPPAPPPAGKPHAVSSPAAAAPVTSLPPVAESVLQLVGNTPMLRVSQIDTGCCELYLKLENSNPGGLGLVGARSWGAWGARRHVRRSGCRRSAPASGRLLYPSRHMPGPHPRSPCFLPARLAPRRLHQGPHRAVNGRGGRGGRQAAAGCAGGRRKGRAARRPHPRESPAQSAAHSRCTVSPSAAPACRPTGATAPATASSGGRIFEATAGNTGLALALVAKRCGYHLTVVVPGGPPSRAVHGSWGMGVWGTLRAGKHSR